MKSICIALLVCLTGCAPSNSAPKLNENQRLDYFKKKFNTERVTVINAYRSSYLLIQTEDGGLYSVQWFGFGNPAEQTITTIFLPKGK